MPRSCTSVRGFAIRDEPLQYLGVTLTLLSDDFVNGQTDDDVYLRGRKLYSLNNKNNTVTVTNLPSVYLSYTCHYYRIIPYFISYLRYIAKVQHRYVAERHCSAA